MARWGRRVEFHHFQEGGQVSAKLSCHTRISDVYVEKKISIGPEESYFRDRVSPRKGPEPSPPLLWNLHIPFSVSEDHRLQFHWGELGELRHKARHKNFRVSQKYLPTI